MHECPPKLVRSAFVHVIVATLLLSMCGCQGIRENLRHWRNNHWMVGPNYVTPATDVADRYLDVDSPSIDPTAQVESRWWMQFNDPELDQLIELLLEQNLTLKSVAERITEARALRNIAAANLLPQDQAAALLYSHTQNSLNAGGAFPGFPLTINNWDIGFDASWELDLWGRIRRGVAAADAQLCAAVKDYDFAMVTLIGDTVSIYIQIRSLDERLELAKTNVTLQQGSLEIAQKRFDEGRTAKLDVVQAQSNLASTKSLIPRLELSRRQARNALAVLLALPPSELEFVFEQPGKIPETPLSAAVGIPAELLLLRPDIRSAERQMAAQFEQIGIAEADLYPRLAVSGTLGYQAATFNNLLDSSSYNGIVAPGFDWKILNFGRLRNNIRVQQARFDQIRFDFQNQVLEAQREVEDAIVEFLKSIEQYQYDAENERANREAVELATALYKEGEENFGRGFHWPVQPGPGTGYPGRNSRQSSLGAGQNLQGTGSWMGSALRGPGHRGRRDRAPGPGRRTPNQRADQLDSLARSFPAAHRLGF